MGNLKHVFLMASAVAVFVVIQLTLDRIEGRVAHFGLRTTGTTTPPRKAGEAQLITSDLLDNVSFSDLKDALLTRYGASAPWVHFDFVKLQDALMAMRLVEKDGQPIGIEGHPYLFIGGAGAAYNYKALKNEGITHIINMSPGTHLKFPGLFKYIHIKDVHENSPSKVTQHFTTTFHYIETARREGGRVLVHGWEGRNRSATIVAAYLMKKHDMSPEEAINLIQKTRPEARPTLGFKEKLDDLDTALRKQNADMHYKTQTKLHRPKDFPKLAHIRDKKMEK